MGRCLVAALFVFLGCSAAAAQFSGGVNIDFNVATGAGAGQPTILYGGAAGQTGYWNPVNGPFIAGAARTIRNLANSADAVTLVVESAGGSGTFSFNNAQTAGDAELLFDDIHDFGTGGTANYSLGPFAGGVYDVYTYAIAPDSAANRAAVSVYTSSTGVSTEVVVGGAMPAGGATAVGVTHSVHRIAVARGERIYVNVRATVGAGSLNGLQIKPVTGFSRLYVRPAAPSGGQTGLSWATACTELQRALQVAADTPSVTEIWITRGPHHPDRVTYSEGNRDATFAVRSNLRLLGGFSGTEATEGERGTSGTATLLDGGDLARHVVTVNGAAGVVFEDLNVINGHDERASSLEHNGAGLRILSSGVTLRRCTIASNTAANYGGAVFVSGPSNVLIEDSRAFANSANGGSFLRQDGGVVTLSRCRVSNNESFGGSGGLINVFSAGRLEMTNTLLANNRNWSWVIDASTASSMSMVNCTVAHNYSYGPAFVGITGPAASTVRNSIIYGNASAAGAPALNGVLRLDSFGNVSDNIVQQWDGAAAPAVYRNFDADPRFRFPSPAGLLAPEDSVGNGQYMLLSRSPARDSGWNNAAPLPTDLGGEPRIIDDPNFPNSGFDGGTVDRGCFEASVASAVCPGDIGRAGGLPGPDGARDNNDFIVFINFFFAGDPRGDVGRSGGFAGADGLFDNNDFIAFINLYFADCP